MFEVLLRGYHDATNNDETRIWLSSLIGHACRELEDFIEPMVSIRAKERAHQMGLDDLRGFHWDHQVRKMKDPDRSIFHWEHFVPVSVLRRRLVALPEPTAESIMSVLARAEIAWILKEENAKLTQLGFGSEREDPIAAYLEAKIVFEAI